MLKVLDLFSGIGGFSLGLERTGGFETVAFCEIEDYPRKVLAKHWPNVPIYRDVRNVTAKQLIADGITVDVITGGFPCQDLSLAGNQAGIEAERSGLWLELCRVIGDVRPKYAIVENVANLLSGPSEQRGGWFGRVLGDLASIGYDAEWHCIPAAAVGAPHRRDRAWIITYPKSKRCSQAGELQHRRTQERISGSGQTGFFTDNLKERIQGSQSRSLSGGGGSFSWCQNVRRAEELRGRPDLPEPLFCGSRDGIPNWVERLEGCGNAVVPQIPELIGYAILDAEAA
ncbi:DNA cytosine methyltransferase [Kiloniella majae]|uniref:DNA cytosine methyltransferase n=1 Tax=Kiloniella majae TaxID=1938558 RepID=UPI000A2780EA|nr:DNA cytosine methyltransferase [Kiloniella majae]